MELDYMENLAREYNKALTNNSSDSLIENSRSIVANQLEILNGMERTNSSIALRYLISLKLKSLALLDALIKRDSVPTPRARSCQPAQQAACRLINYQIELFTNLDTLKMRGVAVEELLQLENRAMSFIAYIR